MKPIAIVGAGIAGLSAARVLAEAGIAVVVFDKSRAMGGRMATRRGDHSAFDHARSDLSTFDHARFDLSTFDHARFDLSTFDHGAQYFKATTAAFRDEIAGWESAGVAATWGEDRFVGVPDMPAPARALGDGLSMVFNCTVTTLKWADGAWTLSALEGPVAQPEGGFGGVVLAMPAPQVANVLAASGLAIPGVETATYAPCWALMVACSTPIAGLETTLRPASDVIAWIATNSAKPQRASTPACYVVHATGAWSRANLELDRETARDALLAEFAAVTGANFKGCSAIAHRWRYALVERAVGHPFLFDARAGVGACGDWCLGPRVEDAWMSGRAMGRHLVQHLAKRDTKAT